MVADVDPRVVKFKGHRVVCIFILQTLGFNKFTAEAIAGSSPLGAADSLIHLLFLCGVVDYMSDDMVLKGVVRKRMRKIKNKPKNNESVSRKLQVLLAPFIAMYRKEECPSLFLVPRYLEGDEQNQKKPTITWHKVLWAIQNLNRKWLLLHKRKITLQSCYNKRFDDVSSRIYDENLLTLNKNFFKSIMDSLKAVESERSMMLTRSLTCISLLVRLVLMRGTTRGLRENHGTMFAVHLSCGRLLASLAIALSNFDCRYLLKR